MQFRFFGRIWTVRDNSLTVRDSTWCRFGLFSMIWRSFLSPDTWFHMFRSLLRPGGLRFAALSRRWSPELTLGTVLPLPSWSRSRAGTLFEARKWALQSPPWQKWTKQRKARAFWSSMHCVSAPFCTVALQWTYCRVWCKSTNWLVIGLIGGKSMLFATEMPESITRVCQMSILKTGY